jgi:hypothetical protein
MLQGKSSLLQNFQEESQLKEELQFKEIALKEELQF